MAKKIVRKKPKQTRSQEVLTSIYQAAYILLDHENPKLFTTNQIAKKAGVSIGSLYQYFPNKETILDQMLQQIVMMLTDEFIKLIESVPTTSYDRFIKQFIAESFDLCLKHPTLMKRTFHIEKSDQTIQTIFSSRQIICDKLVDIMRHKFKISQDIEIKVYMMVHAYMGITEAFVSEKSKFKIEELKEHYAQLILKLTES